MTGAPVHCTWQELMACTSVLVKEMTGTPVHCTRQELIACTCVLAKEMTGTPVHCTWQELFTVYPACRSQRSVRAGGAVSGARVSQQVGPDHEDHQEDSQPHL